MQQIEAVIDQFRMPEVRCALEEMGIDDFMESPIKCHQKGEVLIFRGAALMETLVEKVKLEIVAADEAVTGIVEAIGAITQRGRKGDCRIAILPYLAAN